MIRFFRAVVEIWFDPVYRGLILGVVSILTFGTIFYSIVENWSVLDSLYFSVVTLTTVGYGDFTPDTTLGKLVTIVFIFTGLGIIATFIGTVADRMTNEPGPLVGRFRARHRATPEEKVDAQEVDA